jgi:predicted ATPase/class 3 adenylate cyclase
MARLPTGTVTFLFTDLESSGRLWEEHPEAMKGALARHDEILRDVIESHGGQVVKMTGDGGYAVFATAHEAIEAAVAVQLAVAEERWEGTGPLRVRMGVHTGHAEQRAGDYFGPAVNRAARLMSVAHGGQVVISGASEELSSDALPESVTTTDLGEHRLRDLGHLEHVFQVLHPGLDRDFPPLRSMEAYPSNLRPQLTSFVGRDRELGRIREALGGGRLVTLTGVGGVGKTRLAVQVAADSLAEYADGVWLCELAAAGEPAAMLQVVAAALSVQPRAEVPLETRIRDFLRTKRVLVILDNCEHVLDAACSFVDDVLRECSGVRILATSREALDVAGERVIRVRSLPLPGDADNVGQVASTDAVRLFAERAAAVDPEFVVSSANAASVAGICRRLDGIPLALELAACRVVSLRPAEITALLDERFRLLTGGRHGAVERHQTLRAAVDWSYSLLGGAEQLVFDRLGVFAGSFDEAAAAAVVDEDLDAWTVREVLASLVRKSMLNPLAADEATSRYQLLETLRAYARERLEARGEPDEVRRRHARFYAERADQQRQAMRAGIGLAAVYRTTLLDVDDTRAAISWALDSPEPDDGELALRIAARLGGAVPSIRRATGVEADAARLFQRAQDSSPRLKADILAGLAMDALFVDGDLDRAANLARQGIACMTQDSMLMPYLVLSFCALARGQPDDARQTVAEAQRQFDMPVNRGWFEMLAARVETAAGNPIAARRHAETAIQLARRIDHPLRLAQALRALADVTVRDDPSTARTAIKELVTLERAHAHLGRALTPSVIPSARLSLATHDQTSALHALRAAAELAREIGLFTAIAAAAILIGVLAELHQPQPAATLAGALTEGPYAPLLVLVTQPDDRDQLDVELANLRAHLGHNAYDNAIAAGAAMSLDDIIDTMTAAIDAALANLTP